MGPTVARSPPVACIASWITPPMRGPRSTSFGRTSTATLNGARICSTDASPTKVISCPRSRSARLAATSGWRSPPAPPVATTRISATSALPVRGDVLGLEELQQPLVGAFAADAALLDPTEGSRGVGDEAAVESDHSRLDRLGNPKALRQISRVDVGGETAVGLVRVLDRLIDVPERHHRRDRPENLFLEDVLFRRDVAQHGRRHEVPRAIGRCASGQDAGTVAGGLLDQAQHLLTSRV